LDYALDSMAERVVYTEPDEVTELEAALAWEVTWRFGLDTAVSDSTYIEQAQLSRPQGEGRNVSGAGRVPPVPTCA
jgi:hypothetical protein